MAESQLQRFNSIKQKELLRYLVKRWYLLVLAILIGALAGYKISKLRKPKYTAVFSFVLSTDSRSNNNLAGLAAQLGFDAVTGSMDNIFSGDNIIELFKSSKLIGAALQTVIDSTHHITLLNYIAAHQYSDIYQVTGPFQGQPSTYNNRQRNLYRRIVAYVGSSFTVFRKDKKLIIYTISTTATNPDVAYYVTKCVLAETANYFIETKTKVAVTSVKLLRHEADSLGRVLSGTFNATAANNDRTFNLNPAITVQRAGSMFNQAKVAAYGAAYTEVMRNLEIAKINLQKESPLYRIIDEPDLPLLPDKQSKAKYIVLASVLSLILMTISLLAIGVYKTTSK